MCTRILMLTFSLCLSFQHNTNTPGIAPHLQLFGEEEGDDGGEAGKERGQKHTHIAHINGDVEEVEHVVDGSRCDHQT